MDQGFIEGLDPGQKEAVLSQARRILVVAPPGSGKTRVLVARFIHLLGLGAPPSSIAALTFTNRAAHEMKERITDATGLPPSALNIGTFHSFCSWILKKERDGFRLYTRYEQIELLRELGVRSPRRAVEEISRAKNLGLRGMEQGFDEDILSIYAEAMKERGAIDLDDLILETTALFKGDNRVLFRCRDGFRYLLVDEYQDINPPQREFLKTIVGDRGSIFAIGDPDQSIYAFRGANLDGFLNFERDFQGSEVRFLETNYRSGERIVESSGALISNNRRRAGCTQKALRSGGEVFRVSLRDEKEEAGFIVKEIESLMGGLTSLTVGGPGKNFSFSDFAVLFRTNRQADAIVQAFSSSSIPYRLAGAVRRDIHEFIGHLRGIEPEPETTLSNLIKNEAKRFGLSDEITDALLYRAALYDRLDIRSALDALSEEFLLMDTHEDCDIRADRVALMTLHMAKGLEFPVVFIAGCEQGLMPLERAGRVEDLEEERRLFYVGMTRAKERVYLLSAARRRLRGGIREQKTSRFLNELPERLVTGRTIENKTRRRAFQRGLFESF